METIRVCLFWLFICLYEQTKVACSSENTFECDGQFRYLVEPQLALFEISTDPTDTTIERRVSNTEEKHDSCPPVHQDWKLAIRMDATDMLARYAEPNINWQTRLLQNVCKSQCVLAAICTGHNLDSSKLHSLVAFAKRYEVILTSPKLPALLRKM